MLVSRRWHIGAAWKAEAFESNVMKIADLPLSSRPKERLTNG